MEFNEWWDQYISEGGKTHFDIFANKESSKAAWDARMEPQPIETSPKGVNVLFRWKPKMENKHANAWVIGSICSGDHEGEWWNVQTGVYQSVSHLTCWLPLPPPPKE